MLTLTETATTAVKSIIDRNPTLADGGLRIDSGPDGGSSFGVALVPEAQAGDTTVESGGARVFLEENASRILQLAAIGDMYANAKGFEIHKDCPTRLFYRNNFLWRVALIDPILKRLYM